MNERTVDRHSVNCIYCGEPFDERDSMGQDPVESGDACPNCYSQLLDAWQEAHDKQINNLLFACRCALADLEGIMPEFEPSGDRTHPGWLTIKQLERTIESATRFFEDYGALA